jgi:nucleoside-diphosphate-sugar epimerase
VDDVVEANLLVGFQPVAPGSVFNVAGGGSTTVTEVLDMIAEMHGKPLAVERMSGVKGDVFRTGGSTSAIQQAVGWEPRTSLRDGLAEQYDWAAKWFAAQPSMDGS